MIQHGVANVLTRFPSPVLFSQFLPPQEKSDQNYPAAKGSSHEASERFRSALVVDDVSDVTDMLSVLLTHAGYDVTTASTAPAGPGTARENSALTWSFPISACPR